eukprot:TRINITY_DN44261_c0_g1_i1.p1 TRINITY_DN44261_c0_g1~~TRINITY_DN44261_c0_g1_i1.p1  ORF type:complete len:275 (-),score=24.73 TRINITY_DN44261_c0_g1_i1:204-1028(-)
MPDGQGHAASPREPPVVCCPKGHVMTYLGTSRDDGWACNGRYRPRGCKGGSQTFYQSKGLARTRCNQCDYDLCTRCRDEEVAIAAAAAAEEDLEGAHWCCAGKRWDAYCCCCRSRRETLADPLLEKARSSPALALATAVRGNSPSHSVFSPGRTPQPESPASTVDLTFLCRSKKAHGEGSGGAQVSPAHRRSPAAFPARRSSGASAADMLQALRRHDLPTRRESRGGVPHSSDRAWSAKQKRYLPASHLRALKPPRRHASRGTKPAAKPVQPLA